MYLDTEEKHVPLQQCSICSEMARWQEGCQFKTRLDRAVCVIKVLANCSQMDPVSVLPKLFYIYLYFVWMFNIQQVIFHKIIVYLHHVKSVFSFRNRRIVSAFKGIINLFQKQSNSKHGDAYILYRGGLSDSLIFDQWGSADSSMVMINSGK